MFGFSNRRLVLDWARVGLAVAVVAGLSAGATAAEFKSTAATDVAVEVDRLLSSHLEKNGTPLADSTSDEDFLRRVTISPPRIPPQPKLRYLA